MRSGVPTNLFCEYQIEAVALVAEFGHEFRRFLWISLISKIFFILVKGGNEFHVGLIDLFRTIRLRLDLDPPSAFSLVKLTIDLPMHLRFFPACTLNNNQTDVQRRRFSWPCFLPSIFTSGKVKTRSILYLSSIA